MNTNTSSPIPFSFIQPPIPPQAFPESSGYTAPALRSLAFEIIGMFTFATMFVLGLKCRHRTHRQAQREDEETTTAGVELSNMEVGVELSNVEAGVVTQWMYQYCGMFL